MPRRIAIPPGPNPLAAYTQQISARTLSYRGHDLDNFGEFTIEVEIGVDVLPMEPKARGAVFRKDPPAWATITDPTIGTQYRDWMAARGETVETINRRLSTLRVYIQLVHASGDVSDALVRGVIQTHDIPLEQAAAFDQQRSVTRLQDRMTPELTDAQVEQLKQQPDTPQGHRDAFLICAFVDHGLLRKQMAHLEHQHINLEQQLMHVPFPLATEPPSITLSTDTYQALVAYLDDAPHQEGLLLAGSRRNGKLWGKMSEDAILKRISRLGDAVDIVNLSPLDLRRYWLKQQRKREEDSDNAEG